MGRDDGVGTQSACTVEHPVAGTETRRLDEAVAAPVLQRGDAVSRHAGMEPVGSPVLNEPNPVVTGHDGGRHPVPARKRTE